MEIVFEELTRDNLSEACAIRRDDIPECFVDTASTLMKLTDYGVAHHCIGHTFLIRLSGRAVGVLLLGEAIPWDTDPPEVRQQPFYRLMGFAIDKDFRGRGIGGEAMEKAIELVCRDFGRRPIVLGCHKDNERAAAFYRKHGFVRTDYMESGDYYYLRHLNRQL